MKVQIEGNTLNPVVNWGYLLPKLQITFLVGNCLRKWYYSKNSHPYLTLGILFDSKQDNNFELKEKIFIPTDVNTGLWSFLFSVSFSHTYSNSHNLSLSFSPLTLSHTQSLSWIPHSAQMLNIKIGNSLSFS